MCVGVRGGFYIRLRKKVRVCQRRSPEGAGGQGRHRNPTSNTSTVVTRYSQNSMLVGRHFIPATSAYQFQIKKKKKCMTSVWQSTTSVPMHCLYSQRKQVIPRAFHIISSTQSKPFMTLFCTGLSLFWKGLPLLVLKNWSRGLVLGQ